jgi:hypothetical protein
MDFDEHRKRDESIYGVPVSGSEVVFPNTVRDGGMAEEFLWKGLPNPSPVQRIGAWMLGLVGMCAGMFLVALAVKTSLHGDDPSWGGFALGTLVGIVFFSYGAWTFRLGFRKPRKPISN